MKVVVVGELPFAHELGQLCAEAGHAIQVWGAAEFYDALDNGSLPDELSDADLAIELQNESADAKKKLLTDLAQLLPAKALLLCSAMATSATEAASWLAESQRLIGYGLLPPLSAPGMVELAPALQTADRYLDQAKSFWQAVGMNPVMVKDGPGLVRGRIVCCLINEATSALFEGVASAEDIDVAMRLGTNYPYGPLQWADIIGIDVVLAVMTALFREWGEDRYRPAPLLRRMVRAGYLGRKSGRGFYSYEGTQDW